MIQRRLSKEEFAAALKRGQGRTLLHVQNYGLGDVADLVLEACLHDLSYDPQCEDSRAKWLFEMFYGTSEYKKFATTILAALATETETWDLQQLCELAAEMAARGDREALPALRARVLQQTADTDNWVGASDLVKLDGINAVVDLARCYGNLLLQDPDDSPPPLGQLYDGEVPSGTHDRLKELSKSDPKIKAYWDYDLSVEENRTNSENSKNKHHEYVRQRYPLQKILDDAAAAFGKYPGQYMIFGRHATPAELETVFERLRSEPNEQACVRLLWVFRRTALPRLNPRLWEFAISQNEELRAAALEALAQNRDPSIGEFARKILSNGEFKETDSEVLDMLINNYQPQDGTLITDVIRSIKPESESIHSIGMSILDICEKNQPTELFEALKWMYEIDPCSLCRNRAVQNMRTMGLIEPEMIDECLSDANEEIQKLARELKSKAETSN